MSLVRRVRHTTTEFAAAGTRRAKRAKLELEVRRLKSKLGFEMRAIGGAVHPLLQTGALLVELPELGAHVQAASGLQAQIADRQAQIAAQRSRDAAELAARQTTSMREVDANATAQASADQTAQDVAAEKQGSPAEQGGEG